VTEVLREAVARGLLANNVLFASWYAAWAIFNQMLALMSLMRSSAELTVLIANSASKVPN
jgi:hypothetical protein